MKKYVYDNSLILYSFKELNSYARMIAEIIGYDNLLDPNIAKSLDEDIKEKILDIKSELYLRSNRQ